jgi:hypothetical protein
MYLEVITSVAISDERKHNAGSIVVRFDELLRSIMSDDSITL